MFCAALAGCAAHADRLRDIRNDFYLGQLDRASGRIDEHIRRRGGEADVLKLDRAMIELAAGRPHEAEQILREVRDRFDYLEQKDVAEAAATMLTDDTVSSYPGEDYEKILIRAFLALANLMRGGDDATAYSLQVADVQERIIQAGADEQGQNPKLAYKRVALGPYLCSALREETHANYDDAARAMIRVVNWEPDFPYGRQDLERVTGGRHSAPGNGVLYVFALVGRGPYKEQAVEVPATVSLLVADRILSATTRHTLPPNIAPVKVPKVVVPYQRPGGIRVLADGRPAGITATITDVNQLAAQQYEAIYPQVIARAVVRRVVKKGAVYAGKEALGVANHSLVNLAMDVGGVAWEAAESADTRCWGLLPGLIQVLRLELSAGEHRVGLRPAVLGSPSDPETTVRIADGRNTYVLATFVDDRLIGKVLTSQR